jgi:hypothetical protein
MKIGPSEEIINNKVSLSEQSDSDSQDIELSDLKGDVRSTLLIIISSKLFNQTTMINQKIQNNMS